MRTTVGTPASAGDSLPSVATMRMRPGPLGDQHAARRAGTRAPRDDRGPCATVSTTMSPAEWRPRRRALRMGQADRRAERRERAAPRARLSSISCECLLRRRDNDAVSPVFQQARGVHIGSDSNADFPRRRASWHRSRKSGAGNRRGKPMKLTSVFTALAVAAGCATQALAQAYPSHPITIIVPFSAGGPSDTLARILGERYAGIARPARDRRDRHRRRRQHRRRARAAQSAPDGYTLSIGNWTSQAGDRARCIRRLTTRCWTCSR